MNPSNLYEQYFCAISRRGKHLVMHEVDAVGGLQHVKGDIVDRIFNIILECVKLFGNKQYETYLQATYEDKLELIQETYNKELYIHYKVSSDKRAYEVINSAIGTPYEPVKSKFLIKCIDSPEAKWSEDDVLIAPQYIIVLAKTPEHYLATASAKTNHFDLPVSVGPKMRQNLAYRNSPVKTLSETEGRLYGSYVGRKGLAEMKDRANSVETHRIQYETILDADQPTNIQTCVNRDQHQFGTDKAIELVENVLNVSGVGNEYIRENK